MKKRSFKMATVFVGAAAATVGLGPAALAATALPASRQGSIRVSRCSANVNGISHWVHVYYPNGTHVPECFGFKGRTTAGANIVSACAGNNFGRLHFAGFGSLSFGPGAGTARFGRTLPLSKVSLFGWSGHAAC
jgi:hypothetical protein